MYESYVIDIAIFATFVFCQSINLVQTVPTATALTCQSHASHATVQHAMVLLSQLRPHDDMHPTLHTLLPRLLLFHFLPGLGKQTHITPLITTMAMVMVTRMVGASTLLGVLYTVMKDLGPQSDSEIQWSVFYAIAFITLCHIMYRSHYYVPIGYYCTVYTLLKSNRHVSPLARSRAWSTSWRLGWHDLEPTREWYRSTR